MSRTRLLALLDYYLPGFKSGGPLRTVANMVARLGRQLDFHIVTRDRDATDTAPYPGIQAGAWNEVAGAQVFYAPPGQLTARDLRLRVAEVAPDVIYLNSFFSTLTINMLALRRARLIPPVPVVLAPRGEFSAGALRLKAAKKQAYIATARALGLYNGLVWQASAEDEAADIRRVMGALNVQVAPDIPAPLAAAQPPVPTKAPGRLRLVFLSRIAEKKNLHFLIELLPLLRAETVELMIYGPIREPDYWARCEAMIARLPAHVTARYGGPVEHAGVAAALAEAHAFVLPTLGENFGHAILEALAVGRPILISDQTPWHDLTLHYAGWDLPLNPEPWLSALQLLVAMDQAEYDRWANCARRHAAAFIAAPSIAESNLALFAEAQTRYEAAPPVHP